MRVALISTYASPIAMGLRYISACLKRAGHETQMYFLAARRREALEPLRPQVLEDLLARLREADLIGLSLMTNSYLRAVEVTKAIKQAGIRAPVVWGGVHPTLAPEECLEHADFVCRGEGEEVMLELADVLQRGGEPARIANLAYRRNGSAVLNAPRPLQENLDDLPWPDYDARTHWLAHKGKLVPTEPDRLGGVMIRYRLLTTRGCPFACAFCNNAALQNFYRGKGKWVRTRSVENVIAELEQRVRQFPKIQAINIIDDLFFIRSEEEIEEFCRLYKQRIGLPMELDSYPTLVSRRKVVALKNAGACQIAMGIQSGSPATLFDLYNRRTSLEAVTRAIEIFARTGVTAEYHFIVDNPFEPDENMAETLRFAARHIKPPCVIKIFPLALYPGTPLYERARREGIISQRDEKLYKYVFGGATKGLNVRYFSVMLHIVTALKSWGVSAAAAERFADAVLHRVVRFLLDRRWFPKVAAVVYGTGLMAWKLFIYRPIVRPWRRMIRPALRKLRGVKRSSARPDRQTAEAVQPL